MARLAAFFFFAIAILSCAASVKNQAPVSDPQALAFAAQSITALTGGTAISDVTLAGNATWTAGSGSEIGPVTLLASGTGESRMDLSLPGGIRTEIRDASTGTPQGKWIASGTSGLFASHNCLTDAVWFFPALSSLAGGTNVIFSYVGQETRNGVSVQHIQSYIYHSNQLQGGGATPQQLSTVDFYLDATTLLPSAITFNAHPDSNVSVNLPVEVDYSNYSSSNGLIVPMHIQRHIQGSLDLDVVVTATTVNSGIPVSDFAIQ